MDSKNTVTPSARLRIPHQNLEALSFCPSTPEGVTQWAEQLPVGDIAVLAHTVNQCLQEIIRLNTTTTNRLNLLNAVTPQCHHIFLKTTKSIKNLAAC